MTFVAHNVSLDDIKMLFYSFSPARIFGATFINECKCESVVRRRLVPNRNLFEYLSN